MMVVLYTQDGRQVVITPAPGVTPEQAASAVPAGLSWQVVDGADVSPNPADLIAGYQAAIQAHVDAKAAERNYTSGVHAASYADSTIPAWKAEALAFIAWRDAVWVQAVTTLAQVQGGQIAPPTVAAMIASLPALVWPA
jgi:hypothetical protein